MIQTEESTAVAKHQHYTFRSIASCPMCLEQTSPRQYIGKRLDQPGGKHPDQIKGGTVSIYRCSKCGLVYPNPLPIRSDLEHLGTTSLQDFWGDRILTYAHFDHELSLLPGLIRKPLKELVALDVGFGLGNSLVNMQAHFQEAHGIEPFETFYNKALEVNGSRLNTSRLQCIGFEEVEFPEEKFDFIFFEAIQHLPDLDAGMKKALSLLKRGGILFAEVPSSSYLFNHLINIYYKVRGLDYVIDTNPMHGNYSYYAFTKKSFVENGKRLGYEVIYSEDYPCKPPIGGLAGKILAAVMKSTGTSMQRSVWMRKL